MITLLYLLAAHCVCDYPLQGDFLARGKNHRNPIAGVPWWQCLIAHASIHAGAVLLITGRPLFAFFELLMHVVIDWSKSEGYTTFNQDQALHVICKLVIAALLPFA